MKRYFSLMIFLFLALTGCTEKDDDLSPPSITQENTFSCYIGNNLFIPENHGGFYNFSGYLISILEDNSWIVTLSNGRTTLYLFLKEVKRTGHYEISGSDGNQFFVQDLNTAVELRDEVSNIEYVSVNSASKLEVLHFIPDRELVLQFDEIVLVAVDDPENKIVLSQGKLNINKETLNKR